MFIFWHISIFFFILFHLMFDMFFIWSFGISLILIFNGFYYVFFFSFSSISFSISILSNSILLFNPVFSLSICSGLDDFLVRWRYWHAFPLKQPFSEIQNLHNSCASDYNLGYYKRHLQGVPHNHYINVDRNKFHLFGNSSVPPFTPFSSLFLFLSFLTLICLPSTMVS